MKQKTLAVAAFAAAGAVIAPAAHADLFEVVITGEVEFNLINNGNFANVNPGDAVNITFLLDSDDYTDSDNFPVRGYHFAPESFNLTMGSVSIGLEDPFPKSARPTFVIRNNDPQVDGFYLSTFVDSPSPVPLNEVGQFGNFGLVFEVGYEGDTLDSLELADASGMYDFDGLTNFYFGVTDGPVDVIGFIFSDMEITVIPAPAGLAVLAPLGLLGATRRRRRA